jgi:hypothetical protein
MRKHFVVECKEDQTLTHGWIVKRGEKERLGSHYPSAAANWEWSLYYMNC